MKLVKKLLHDALLHDAAEGLLEVCIICSIEALPLFPFCTFPDVECLYCMGQINASLCEVPPELKASLLLVPYRNTTVSALFYPEEKSEGNLFLPSLLHLLIS